MILRTLVIAAVVAGGGSAQAASKKETDCGHQASVVGAIQQARIDRVGERKVAAHVTENATWPENYNGAIPIMTPWVYEMKMRDVKKQDLAAAWNEMCLQQ
jgi:hypothetical protein